MSLAKKMGDAHEERLCEAFDGRMTRGSGNQAKDPMDGKHTRLGEVYAFAWDGKSTRSRSNTVTLAMWDKAVEQARDRRPMLGLCFYFDDRLRSYLDLVVMRQDDAVEMRQDAVKLHQVCTLLRAVAHGQDPSAVVGSTFYEEDGDPIAIFSQRLLELLDA